MSQIDILKEQIALHEAVEDLSLPDGMKREVFSALGEQIARGIESVDENVIREGIEQAYIAVSVELRKDVEQAMRRWLADTLISADAAERMLTRIPDAPGAEFSGLDAGVAASLGIVPEDKQDLIRSLHAYYTPDAVAQVRNEIAAGLNPDSETAWWLSMCSLCIEGQIDAKSFVEQAVSAKQLAANPAARKEAAIHELSMMTESVDRFEDGVGYGTKDGCIQGAYLNNCDIGVSDMRPIGAPIFIGTFRGSEVNLDNFEWGTNIDERGRPKSGQIAPGFYKVEDEAERDRLLEVLKEQLYR